MNFKFWEDEHDLILPFSKQGKKTVFKGTEKLSSQALSMLNQKKFRLLSLQTMNLFQKSIL